MGIKKKWVLKKKLPLRKKLKNLNVKSELYRFNGVVPLMLQEVAQHPGNGW